MDWFKHSTKSHEDPDISDAWDQFGDSGPTVFWTILEVFGAEFSHLKDGWMTLSVPYFERKTRRKFKKSEKILEFFQNRGRIYFKKDQLTISLTIPKFIKIASNWTVRPQSQPTAAPTEAPTEAPHAIEEKRIEEKNKHIERENPPTPQPDPPPPPDKKPLPARKTIPPTMEMVTAYCLERKNGINPSVWWDHYQSKGWRIGKEKMVDWQAAVRTWETKRRNDNDRQGNSGSERAPTPKAGRSRGDDAPYPTDTLCTE